MLIYDDQLEQEIAVLTEKEIAEYEASLVDDKD